MIQNQNYEEKEEGFSLIWTYTITKEFKKMKKVSSKKEEDKVIEAFIIQDFLPKLWAVFACEENDVHYLIRDKKTDAISWKNLKQLKDLRDMVVVANKVEAETIIQWYITSKAPYPKKVVAFDICEIIPSFTDEGYWYEDVTSKRVKVK